MAKDDINLDLINNMAEGKTFDANEVKTDPNDDKKVSGRKTKGKKKQREKTVVSDESSFWEAVEVTLQKYDKNQPRRTFNISNSTHSKLEALSSVTGVSMIDLGETIFGDFFSRHSKEIKNLMNQQLNQWD